MQLDTTRELQLDRESRGMRYYRNAVERHWDPGKFDFEDDLDRLIDFVREDPNGEQIFEQLQMNVARFGAGEQAVTEDLAPLATALDDIDDQMFITTQIYEEAKHTDFFDRYWREVIHGTADELGLERVSPTDPRWYNDAYDDLFERNERAMEAVLDDQSPETFATAYCHYHLTIEGILAQTGYYGMQQSFSEDSHPELPGLPGLFEGFNHIRQDEGRHVGFGMAKLKELLTEEDVDPQLLSETVNELMPLVDGITTNPEEEGEMDIGPTPDELRQFASEKHVQRMQQITDASEEIPDVETLTELEGVDA